MGKLRRAISLTDEKLNSVISTVASCVSLVMALFVLGSASVIYKHKSARHILDRVSFRLLLWSMGFEVVYNVAYITVRSHDFRSSLNVDH